MPQLEDTNGCISKKIANLTAHQITTHHSHVSTPLYDAYHLSAYDFKYTTHVQKET